MNRGRILQGAKDRCIFVLLPVSLLNLVDLAECWFPETFTGRMASEIGGWPKKLRPFYTYFSVCLEFFSSIFLVERTSAPEQFLYSILLMMGVTMSDQ